MRAFLFAVVAAVAITAVAALVLDQVQTNADVANTTTGARINVANGATSTKH